MRFHIPRLYVKAVYAATRLRQHAEFYRKEITVSRNACERFPQHHLALAASVEFTGVEKCYTVIQRIAYGFYGTSLIGHIHAHAAESEPFDISHFGFLLQYSFSEPPHTFHAR